MPIQPRLSVPIGSLYVIGWISHLNLLSISLSLLQVYTEGRLIVEFTFDDMMRIRSWHFAVRTHRELIPRSVLGMQQDPGMVESLSKNVTRQGMTSTTLNYLRVRKKRQILMKHTGWPRGFETDMRKFVSYKILQEN